MDINFTYPQATLITAVHQLIEHNQVMDGILRLYLTPHQTWISTTAGLPYDQGLYGTGLRAMISEVRKNETSPLTGLKTFNYLENILIKKMASAKGFGEAILFNTQGNLAEGTVSNIFLVKNNQLITPSCREGILPGITRQFVLDLAENLKLPIIEGQVSPEELLSVDECFLTNSLMEIMPLVQVDNTTINQGHPGPITKLLHKHYRSACILSKK